MSDHGGTTSSGQVVEPQRLPVEPLMVRPRAPLALDEGGTRYSSHELLVNGPPSEEGGSNINLLAMIWRRRWTLLLCVLLGLGGAFWYLYQAEPVYRSTATVQVRPNSVRLVGEGIQGTSAGNNFLNTEVAVMQSSRIMQQVMRVPGLAEGPSIRGSDNPSATVANMLEIAPADKMDVIFISAQGPDKNDTRIVANAVLDAYLAEVTASERSTASDLMRILSEHIATNDMQLEEVHQQKIEMSRNIGALSSDGAGNIMVSQLGSLEQEINRAYTDVLNTEVMLNEIKKAGADEGLVRALLPGGDERNGDLWSMLRALERDRRLLSLRLGERNRQVEQLDAQIEIIREELRQVDAATIESSVKALEAQHAGAVARYEALKQAYDQQLVKAFDANEERAEYERLLSRERRINAEQDTLLSRMQDIDVNDDASGMKATPMEIARDGVQVGPKQSQALGMGLVLGLMLGTGLAFLLEWADPRLRDAEEIQQLLDVSILGAVPALDKRAGQTDRSLHVAHHPNTEASESFRDIRTVLFFELGLNTRAGQGASQTKGVLPSRDLATKMATKASGRVILVTSPLSGDGKTTTASNLAAAIADAGQRTLLIDADCRRPSVAKYLDISGERGLTNVLGVSEVADLKDVLQRCEVTGLDILPCGPHPERPAEMLNSAAFSDLLEDLRQQYDVIVIDSPPVLPVTDARILSDQADATVLVLRAGRSARRSARHAVDSLLRVNARLVGVIVNDVPIKKKGFGYGYPGAYGYYYRYSYASTKNGTSQDKHRNGYGTNGHGTNGHPLNGHAPDVRSPELIDAP